MLDLSYNLTEGTKLLIRWRGRYTPYEYPEKVVLNIFYRRYTMSLIWNRLMDLISRHEYSDVQMAYETVQRLYSDAAVREVLPYLTNWLEINPNKIVGAISYSEFQQLINNVKSGSKVAKEELEFSFLFHYLSDVSTLFWVALCMTGVTKLEAITKVSDAIIQPMALNDYNTVTSGLGQLLVSRFMQNKYTPLP